MKVQLGHGGPTAPAASLFRDLWRGYLVLLTAGHRSGAESILRPSGLAILRGHWLVCER
ncbi:MAG: hypothetical protein HFI43_02955 [Lachnospiraceae bacterium]|nr:hypothetical protein [Lachnospiraceae bacterium]